MTFFDREERARVSFAGGGGFASMGWFGLADANKNGQNKVEIVCHSYNKPALDSLDGLLVCTMIADRWQAVEQDVFDE